MKTVPFTQEEEEKLVRAMQEGDQKAFEKLMKEFYESYIRGLCLRIIPHQHIIDDAVSIAMMNIWKKPHLFSFQSSFKTWVHSVTFYVALNMIKKEERHWKGRNCIDMNEKSDPLLVTACKRNRPEQSLMYKEIVDVVQFALSQLSKQHRKVITMVGDDWTCAQIAVKLNIPPGTVRSQLYYARKYIRNELLNAGIFS